MGEPDRAGNHFGQAFVQVSTRTLAGAMPSETTLVEEVPEITFEKGMFRVHYDSGRTDAFSPHVFMVSVRAAQTAIEAWFATGQSETVEFKRAGSEH